MTTKLAYCSIPPRKKKILFTSSEEESDREALKKAIIKNAEKDPVLKQSLDGNILIVQIKDSFLNDWCDVEDDEEIKDKSEVKIILIPELKTIEVAQAINLEFIDNNSETKLIENCTNNRPFFIEDSSNVNSNDILIASSCHQNNEKQVAKKIKLDTCKKSSVDLNILPPLTDHLKGLLEKNGIEKSQKNFFNFWGNYLFQSTNEQPTKQDYLIFSNAIIAAYPVLKGTGKDCTSLVRSMLSSFIRNRRYTTKQKEIKNKSVKQDVSDKSSNQEDSHEQLVQVPLLTSQEQEKALLELKKFIPNKNVKHFQRLLELTTVERRKFIESEALTIKQIVKEYPILSDYEMIMYEFCNNMFVTDEAILINRCQEVISDLKTYYNSKAHNISEWMILQNVFEEMLPKMYKNKVAYPLFLISQVGASLECLKGQVNAAPRVVIFINDNDPDESQVYLAADEQMRIQVPNPSAAKVVVALIATYWVWHQSFPIIYKYTLEFFSFRIFEKCTSPQGLVGKFLRKLANSKCANEKNNTDQKVEEVENSSE